MGYFRIIFALLAAIPLWSQTPPGFVVSGTVVQADTSQSLGHVLVTLARTQAKRGEEPLAVITDTNGSFRFDGLPAGKYVLSAQRSMSIPQRYLQHGQYSTAIVTGPGLDTVHIRFPLTPLTSISGAVTDEENEPVRQGSAYLFRKGVVERKYQVFFAGQSPLDNTGEFYFGHLEPGTYFVGVVAHPWYAQNDTS